MSEKSNYGRRKVVKYAGVGLSALAGTSSTISAREDNPVSAEAAGIEKAVQQLLHNGKVEKATNLLEKHNVKYDVVRDKTPSPSTSGDVSTQDYWDRASATAAMTGYHKKDNLYHGHFGWTLDSLAKDVDDSMPDDGVTVGWEDSVFSYEPGSLNTHYDALEAAEDRASYTLKVDNEPLVDSPGSSIGAKVNDQIYYNRPSDWTVEPIQGYVEFDVTKENSVEGNLGGEYTHTWNVGGFTGGSITFSAGAGVVGLDVSLPTGTVDKYELPDQTSEKLVKL